MEANFRKLAKKAYYTMEKLAGAAGVSGEIPEIEQARAQLRTYSPDNGSGCYLEKERNWNHSDGSCQLSIVVPVYNVAQYIEQCVHSILKQETAVSYELILVNDGSPDKSREIIAQFADDARVTIIDQENGGASAARNVGIDRAKGAYIMFVDADDTLCPEAIELLMTCAQRYDADVVAGAYNLIKNGKYTQPVHYKNERVNPQTAYYGMPWGKVYKREVFDHLKFPEHYWYEDSIFAQIVWPSCDHCYTISACVYNYLDNANGATRFAKGKPKSLDSLYITERLLEERAHFGLTIGNEAYDYFLHMVLLTRLRTDNLPVEIKKCIFTVQCELWKKYYTHCSTEKDVKLQNALKQKNFKQYLLI